MTYLKELFPYHTINPTGKSYFKDVYGLFDLGFSLNQIWTVMEEDLGDHPYIYRRHIYGPPYCAEIKNTKILGYIGTKEKHNNETFYEETFHNSDLMAQGELPG